MPQAVVAAKEAPRVFLFSVKVKFVAGGTWKIVLDQGRPFWVPSLLRVKWSRFSPIDPVVRAKLSAIEAAHISILYKRYHKAAANDPAGRRTHPRLLTIVGGAFALTFVDPWLERRRYRHWRRSLTNDTDR